MNREEAHRKAVKIGELVGATLVTKHKDGSKTIKKNERKKEISLNEIVRIILE